ncbi:thioesterase family protein [Rhodobacteraceae bacterium D3-12]|nr:thioesterase family protein [Rhodobacteraceae bacterium D3-12]
MIPLSTLLADMVETDGGFASDVPDNWTQGRTTFGGLTAALSVAAAQRAFPDLPPLRTMQVAYMRPASGALDLRPTLLRRGRSAAFVEVDCRSQGESAVRVTLVFGEARDSALAHDFSHEDVPAPEDCPRFMPESAQINFMSNFDMRLATGAHLLSGAETPAFSVWMRLRDPGALSPIITMACLGDGLPPAAMASFDRFGPVSTITWSLDIAHIPDTLDWVRLSSFSEQAEHGYSLQNMALHDLKGHRLGAARQNVAIFV